MKYLYKKTKNVLQSFAENSNLDVEIFIPTIREGFILRGENKSFKLMAIRCLFQMITLGKAKIYCYRADGELVHTSYVIPKCCKFPFMGKEDYEIGPCFTYPKFRGKGLYSQMLKYICSSVGTYKTNFYMIVDETNLPSIRGIEKADFKRCGNVRVTKILKKYKFW